MSESNSEEKCYRFYMRNGSKIEIVATSCKLRMNKYVLKDKGGQTAGEVYVVEVSAWTILPQLTQE